MLRVNLPSEWAAAKSVKNTATVGFFIFNNSQKLTVFWKRGLLDYIAMSKNSILFAET